MTLVLAMNLVMFAGALAGMVYTVRNLLLPRKALYLQMIGFGIGCLMFGRLFSVIYLLTQGDLNYGFHLGLLGIMGSFMFFLAANYGQMDGLVDDRSKAFRATRIKALLVPAVIIVFFLLLGFLCSDKRIWIAALLVVIFMVPASYYNFKHIIIYDVDLGIIRTMKQYNILAVVYAFLILFELYGRYLNIVPLYIAVCIGSGLVSAAIPPIAKGGAEKWTI